jgi:hypothetical protein
MTAKSIPLDELCDDSQDAELEVCPGRIEEVNGSLRRPRSNHTLLDSTGFLCEKQSKLACPEHDSTERGDEINYDTQKST